MAVFTQVVGKSRYGISKPWLRYVVLPILALSICFGADLARAQTIKINSDLGSVPAGLLDEAAWAFRERLGLDMTIVGTSHVDCEAGHIIVRRATPAEWAGFGLPAATYATANGCDSTGGWGQVIWHPTEPFQMIGLRHEIGHTAGCWQHMIINVFHVMSGAPTEPFLTESDIACITASNWWGPLAGDRCFVEVAKNLDLYIPSLAGSAVWYTYTGIQGGFHTWTERRKRATSLSCPGNTQTGMVMEFDDARGYGMASLEYARLRDMEGFVRLEAAR